MSNTIVRDCTPAPKPGDNALVIVVGEDGTLSVDPETLNSLLHKGGNSTEVSIVRMSGSDPVNNTVDATLETFFDTNPVSTTIPTEKPQVQRGIMEELKLDIDEVDEITRLCRNVHMDHCYTPLTSPSQKLPPPRGEDNDGETGSGSLVQSQTLNKSTEDLMAVLEADTEPIKPPSSQPTSIQPSIVKVSKVDTNVNRVTTIQASTTPTIIPPSAATLVQTINKNFQNLTSLPKKTVKIVAVTKPPTGVRSAIAAQPQEQAKPTLAVREPVVKKETPPPKEVENTPAEIPPSTNSSKSLDEDLSDISSDSDFEMDDDSDDSDFDAGRQKISKPKYKTFGSQRGRSSAARARKDKIGAKGGANRSSAKGKKLNTSNRELSRTPGGKGKTGKSKSKGPVLTPEKEEPIQNIASQEVPQTPEKQTQEQSKKQVKKKVAKPVGLFDDGIALFSTPDVIRRVSVGGKSDTSETPTKLSRTSSTEQNLDSFNHSHDKVQNSNKDTTDSNTPSNLVSIDDNKPAETSKLSGVDSTTLDATEQNLAALDNANLDLDLNPDELIPEDLLFQVAKLVENADIQKVIDTNLNLVDQNLGNLESVLPKSETDNFANKDFNHTESTTISATKELENIMAGSGSQSSIKSQQHKLQQQNTSQQKVPSSTTAVPVTITKNTTNKPIQIVRPDGRVIIIPPIEKPATRSSKRKQTGDPTNNVTTPVAITPTTKSLNLTPTTQKTITTTSAIHQQRNTSSTTLDHDKKSQKSDTSGFNETVAGTGGGGGGEESEISDSDESWKSEDDPDRLWCICKQPHNNRFMICCDTCEEWFHGQCVGVSKALGRQMEQQGKEWQCPNCQKAKKTALQQALNEAQATMNLSPSNSEPQSTDPDKPIQRCIVCKGPSRSGSVYCSEKCIVQHSNAVERVIVFERATGKCLSGTNAPTVANLKQWLKQHPGFEVVSSGTKTLTPSKIQTNKIPKVGVQAQPNKVTKTPSTEQPSKPPPTILNHLNKSLLQKSSQAFYGKQQQNVQSQSVKSPTTTVPLKIQQLKQTPPTVKTAKLIQPHVMMIKQPGQNKVKAPTTPTTTTTTTAAAAATTPQTPKAVAPQTDAENNKKKSTSLNKSTVTPQKVSRTKSTSSTTADDKQSTPMAAKGPEQLRENVRKTLAEHFSIRLKEQDEIKMTDDEVKTLSNEIEAELFALFNKDTGAKYRNRYRSLIFNIKDTKNETLWRRICSKAVTPKELVRLSPEELASQELAQWRERETKHQLDMIKKTELDLLSCVRTYVLKSHKGEEVIEKKVDAVDSTIVADLDSSLNEGRAADSTSERTKSLQDSISKESSRSKSTDEKEKHEKHRKDSSSSGSKHKRDRSRDRSSRKHRDGSRDRKKRSRSRDRSRDRRRDTSKDRRNSDSKKRHRSRSGSRHKSTDHDHKSRHKHKDHDRHKSSRHKHSSSKRKDSESDSTSSSIVKNLSKENKAENSDLITMGLDKKSKEILESLVDNKVVDDRILKAVEEPSATVLPVPADSESDHEPSSTVTITTPPRNVESESAPAEKAPVTTPLQTVIPEVTTPEDNSDASESVIKKNVTSVSKPPLPPPPLTSADGPVVWRGFINMVDVAKFRITAQEVSGDCVGLASELSPVLDIVGRISPDTVWEYLSKMRRSTAKYISILRLMAESAEEQSAYQSLYTYLSSRKRFGVVKTANTSIKDFYIMPQASYNPLPQVLLPLNGPGFEESRPNLLLGILVSSKRKRPQIYETTPPTKKARESPPRSYTPPPTTIMKDPRILPQRNLVSSIAMPPLPTVTPIPTGEFQKPEPPPLDDMDEPYSPGDSDDTLPTIPVNIISKPKTTTVKEKEKPVVRPPPPKEPVVSDLSILEPFKTSNFSSIPGLDTAAPITDPTNSSTLGVSSLLSGALSSTTSTSLDTPTTTLPSELNTTDLDALQRNIDEINKRIERERQEIDSISMGIVQKEDLESSCLANIALPSNLRQILDSIKTKKSDEKETVDVPTTKATKPPVEEYLPSTLIPSTSANYTPSTPTTLPDDSLPTIPLLLPKIPRSSLEPKSTSNTISTDLNIPLNLPIPKRTFSPGIKRPIDSPEIAGDYKRKRFDSPNDKKMELPQIPLKFPLVPKKSYTSTPIKAEIKEEGKENLTEQQTDSKSSSVLSTLSAEELIRKANEMLAAQSDVKEDAEEDDDEDDEPYDPETSEPVEVSTKVTSIKQAPVLYPNTSIPPPNLRFIPNLEQPPVPGLEDYE